MQRFPGVVQDTAGNALASASITVYNQGTTTKATIYSDNARTVLANPFVCNPDGTYEFYAQDGRYDVNVVRTGFSFTTTTTYDAVLYDGPSLGVVNVKDYGAKGDGATDDTSSIQNAYVAAPSGSVLYFPPGNYKLTTTLSVTKNIHILGPGAFGGAMPTKLNWFGGASAMLDLQAESLVQNLAFDNHGTATHAIKIRDSNHFHLVKVSINPAVAFTTASVETLTGSVQAPGWVYFVKCYIRGTGNGATRTPIGLKGTTGSLIVSDGSTWFDHNTNVQLNGISAFYFVNGSDNEILTGSVPGIGIDVATGTNNHLVVQDSFFEAGDAGQIMIRVQALNGGLVEGNYFNGNNANYAITSTSVNAVDVTVRGNSFFNCATQAVRLTASTNWTIGENYLGTTPTSVLGGSGEGNLVLANGSNDNVTLPVTPQVYIAGPTGVFTVTGVVGGRMRPGQIVVLFNSVNQQMTLAHESGASTNVNRLWSSTGADVVIAGTASGTWAQLMFVAPLNRWLILGHS